VDGQVLGKATLFPAGVTFTAVVTQVRRLTPGKEATVRRKVIPLDRLVFRHWNGKTWTAVPFPSAPKAAHQVISDFRGLAVGSKNDVWTTGFAELVTSTFWMLHWNGKKWSELRVPYAIDSMDYLPRYLISADGHGGVTKAAKTQPARGVILQYVSWPAVRTERQQQ
jgi:hypothetical protein